MIAAIIATGHCAKYFILVNKFDLYNNPEVGNSITHIL